MTSYVACLAIAFGALLAVIGLAQDWALWSLVIPLVVVLVFGRAYDHAVQWRRGDAGGVGAVRIFVGLSIPVVLARGSEFASQLVPMLSIVAGVVVWLVLRRLATRPHAGQGPALA
ncbi:hypothetical protein [Nesterenkonia suensis]